MQSRARQVSGEHFDYVLVVWRALIKAANFPEVDLNKKRFTEHLDSPNCEFNNTVVEARPCGWWWCATFSTCVNNVNMTLVR